MAMGNFKIKVYNESGSEMFDWIDIIERTTFSINDLLSSTQFVNNGVNAVSETQGGQPIPGTDLLDTYASYNSDKDLYQGSLYKTTPVAETITGFYLDGTEYKFEGGGASYTAGNGIDITNDEIGLDGTYEGDYLNYSAMKGPAPEGFHVPLTTEWQAVRDIRTALGGGSSDGTNFGIALKLPFAGTRLYSTAGLNGQGSYGYYWSSSRSSTKSAYILYFRSTALNPQSTESRARGFSVRCFKNSPVVPMSSWTKLYGTSIESGGIFWSSTDGLISLSSDGTTWITIVDKNLGATTVWNSGDTLSEANCGKYYQRGNNYGFPRTGTIANRRTTQVDASSYGPGNYYSSDTFIKYSGRWDTTDNGNLRGGETYVQTVSGNLILGDKLYKIVTSTTAPASGTDSNIITIVTD